MRAVIPLIVVAVISVSSLPAQILYYSESEGDHYEKQSWHSAPLSRFLAEKNVSFDAYTFRRRSDGTSIVARDYATPSGDWIVKLTYLYGANGRLRFIRWDTYTFHGSKEGEGLTRCVRTFTVTPRGELIQKSERITDDKTGKVVDRSFWSPRVKHWMSLAELPIKPET